MSIEQDTIPAEIRLRAGAGPPADPDEREYERRWWTLGVLCISLVMIVMANASLNVALPTLAESLDTGASGLQWIVDAYSLVFAGLLLTAGSLGDRYGRRLALNGGLIVFGAASLFAVLSSSSGAVIGARAVMGVGAAFVMPATLSILAHVFPPKERPRAIAIWAGFAGVGVAMGGVVSGALLEHFWWGSIFLINVVVVVVALVAGFFLIPRSREKIHAPLDPLGALLSIAGLSALVYGIIEAPDHGWASTQTLVTFARRDRGPGRVRGVGAEAEGADARPRLLPQPALHRGDHRDHARVLRHVRFVLPLHPVPAVRARLRPAVGGRADPAVGARLPGVGDAVGEAGGALRPAAGGGVGLTIAGARHRAAGGHEHGDLELLVVRAGGRGAGARHGHHDRAVDGRDHAVAAAAQGGRRLGGERHHP